MAWSRINVNKKKPGTYSVTMGKQHATIHAASARKAAGMFAKKNLPGRGAVELKKAK